MQLLRLKIIVAGLLPLCDQLPQLAVESPNVDSIICGQSTKVNTTYERP